MTDSLTIQSRPAELAHARAFVAGFLAHTAFPETEGKLVVLAVDEACSNIIRHAYGDTIGPILIHIAMDPSRLVVTIRDHGRPVATENLEGRPLDEIRPGGLGIHFIHSAFNKVEYLPMKDGTRLVMVKTLRKPTQES